MFLLINKPVGITSHDVVDYVRNITGERRVGHAGTLDPFADGLLIVAVGRESTKQFGTFLKLDKQYRAVLHLGAETDTYDCTGIIQKKFSTATTNETINKYKLPSINEIQIIIQNFTGIIKQTPPMFSAKKINGKKLYELARRGIEIKRESVQIIIYSISIIMYLFPSLTLDIHCGSGTYIRSLAHDIGQALGCSAYLTALTRTAIGKFSIADAVPLEILTRTNVKQYFVENSVINHEKP